MSSFASSQGPDDIVKRIKTKSAECPSMKFAVIGYSQGGSVATSGLTKVARGGLADKVVAVVLYAPFMGASPPREFSTKTLQNCASGDPVRLKQTKNNTTSLF